MKLFILIFLLLSALYAEQNSEKFEKGMEYLLGSQSVKQDKRKAFEYLSEASKEGDAAAEYNLALMYYMGDGVDQNLSASLKLLNTSALKGYKHSIENIGRIYMMDYQFSKAIKWLKINAKNGDAQANYFLAEIYVQKEDFKSAKLYAQKAIESGIVEAEALYKEYKLSTY